MLNGLKIAMRGSHSPDRHYFSKWNRAMTGRGNSLMLLGTFIFDKSSVQKKEDLSKRHALKIKVPR